MLGALALILLVTAAAKAEQLTPPLARNTPSFIAQAEFSSAGDFIIFLADERGPGLFDLIVARADVLRNRTVVPVAKRSLFPPSVKNFVQAGERIYFVTLDGDLWLTTLSDPESARAVVTRPGSDDPPTGYPWIGAVAPDQKSLVFNDGDAHYLFDLASEQTFRLTSETVYNIRYSPDGRRLAFLSDWPARLFHLDINAPKPLSISELSIDRPGSAVDLVFSSDGDRLVFTLRPENGSDSIFSAALDGAEATRQISPEAAAGATGLYSALRVVGQEVYFRSLSNQDEDIALYQSAIDGSSPPQRIDPVTAGRSVVIAYDVSTDGDVILSQQTGDAPARMYLKPPAGPAAPFAPDVETNGYTKTVFTPDGIWVVSASAESIWIVPKDQSLPPQLLTETGVGQFMFDRYGRSVIFTTLDSDQIVTREYSITNRSIQQWNTPAQSSILVAISPTGEQAIFTDRFLVNPGRVSLWSVRQYSHAAPSLLGNQRPESGSVTDFYPLADGRIVYTADQREYLSPSAFVVAGPGSSAALLGADRTLRRLLISPKRRIMALENYGPDSAGRWFGGLKVIRPGDRGGVGINSIISGGQVEISDELDAVFATTFNYQLDNAGGTFVSEDIQSLTLLESGASPAYVVRNLDIGMFTLDVIGERVIFSAKSPGGSGETIYTAPFGPLVDDPLPLSSTDGTTTLIYSQATGRVVFTRGGLPVSKPVDTPGGELPLSDRKFAEAEGLTGDGRSLLFRTAASDLTYASSLTGEFVEQPLLDRPLHRLAVVNDSPLVLLQAPVDTTYPTDALYLVSVEDAPAISRIDGGLDGSLLAFELGALGQTVYFAKSTDQRVNLYESESSMTAVPRLIASLDATAARARLVVTEDQRSLVVGLAATRPRARGTPEEGYSALYRVFIPNLNDVEEIVSPSFNQQFPIDFKAQVAATRYIYYTALDLAKNVTHLYRLPAANQEVFVSGFETSDAN